MLSILIGIVLPIVDFGIQIWNAVEIQNSSLSLTEINKQFEFKDEGINLIWQRCNNIPIIK